MALIHVYPCAASSSERRVGVGALSSELPAVLPEEANDAGSLQDHQAPAQRAEPPFIKLGRNGRVEGLWSNPIDVPEHVGDRERLMRHPRLRTSYVNLAARPPSRTDVLRHGATEPGFAIFFAVSGAASVFP